MTYRLLDKFVSVFFRKHLRTLSNSSALTS